MTEQPPITRDEVRVTWHGGWGEWLPRCVCGWVGSYCKRKPDAVAEADRHFSEHESNER